MKKSRIFSMMLLFIFMCLPLASAQGVNMAYLNGDKNFPSVYAAGNTGNAFIDKSSLNVQLYNPPYYRIAAIIVHTPLDSNEIYRWDTVVYEYRWDNDNRRSMFYHTADGRNHYLDWKHPSMAGLRDNSVGEAMFYLAYHKKFYGDISKNATVGQSLYSRLDGTY